MNCLVLTGPQLLSHQERVAELQEKQVNLRKDLAEMQEWMAQVDEEFLMRDFEYKGPEELEASLEEMKVRRLKVLPYKPESEICLLAGVSGLLEMIKKHLNGPYHTFLFFHCRFQCAVTVINPQRNHLNSTFCSSLSIL